MKLTEINLICPHCGKVSPFDDWEFNDCISTVWGPCKCPPTTREELEIYNIPKNDSLTDQW